MKTGKKFIYAVLAAALFTGLVPSDMSYAETKEYSFTLTVYDSSTGEKLNGAVFELWKAETPDFRLTGFIKGTADSSEYTYSAAAPDIALISSGSGMLKISSLPAGRYYLKQTDASDSYTVPSGSGALIYFTLGSDRITSSADTQTQSAAVQVTGEHPYGGKPAKTYGPRLADLQGNVRFLSFNGERMSAERNYVSSFARTEDDPDTDENESFFYHNNCIENYESGHAYDFITDDLLPQLRWLYSNSPAVRPIAELKDIVEWYYKNIPGLVKEDFNLDKFAAYYDTDEKKLDALADMNKIGAADYMDVLKDVGLENFDQFVELVITQIAFSGVIWHFTDGVEVKDGSDYGWPSAGIGLPPAVMKIYNWYLAKYNNEIGIADAFYNVPKTFSLVRTDNGSDPLHHTYKLIASPANTNWSGFEVSLSGTGASLSSNSAVSKKTLNASDNEINVYLNSEGTEYELVMGDSFLIDVWFGRESDGLTAGEENHLQDHAIVVYGKKAEVTADGRMSGLIMNTKSGTSEEQNPPPADNTENRDSSNTHNTPDSLSPKTGDPGSHFRLPALLMTISSAGISVLLLNRIKRKSRNADI